MGRGVITEPTLLRLYDLTPAELLQLQTELHYTDGRLKFAYSKFRKATWYVQKHGMEAFKEELKRKKAEMEKSLLFSDDAGYWTYSGLAEKIAVELQIPIKNEVVYPDAHFLAWEREPKKTPRPYQSGSYDALLLKKHAGVELATGLGKTFILTLLVKALGLKTVVMAPSVNIAEQIYADFIELFGEKKVGFYGDGSHDSHKLITVAVAASLNLCKVGSEAWLDLCQAQVFIADESHLCPAETLKNVCFGLMADAPYRFFFSATQLRNDGLDLLLDAITGPIVYSMTVQEGIAQGYLAALDFFMLECMPDPNAAVEGDPNRMTRDHLYYNPNVYKGVANFINRCVKDLRKRVLVLVDELEQFTMLQPLIQHQLKFAHGAKQKKDTQCLPEPFRKSDPGRFVREFNDEQFPVLVGTSCISTGSDIKANEVTVYLRGGKSEVEIYQGAMGRSTRKFEFKDGHKKNRCMVVDVVVPGIESVERHGDVRSHIYGKVGTVKTIRLAAA